MSRDGALLSCTMEQTSISYYTHSASPESQYGSMRYPQAYWSIIQPENAASEGFTETPRERM